MGRVHHPNSTFISFAHVPEDLTTVTVLGQHAGGWVNTHNVSVGLSSEPPMLPDTLANHQNFVASPIKSITYGLSSAGLVPDTKFAVSGDVTLTNSNGCPSAGNPSPPASAFAPQSQSLLIPLDGMYLLHYFAQDCAGTEELQFTSSGNGGWSTSFYTVPINVDTVAPVVASGPTFSVAPKTINGVPGSFTLGQQVFATYRCTDDRSGVATCGSKTYGAPGTLDTGNLTTTLDTSTAGSKTFTVQTTDSAGNAGTPVSVTYNVAATTSADLTVLQVAPATVKRNATLLYNVLVLNLGPDAAQGVVIKDSLPAGTTVISAGYQKISCSLFTGCENQLQPIACSVSGNNVECDVAQLKALKGLNLDSINVEILVRVTAAVNTTLTNTVSVTSSAADHSPGNNSSTTKTVVR